MKRIPLIMIIMIGFVFGQSLDELRKRSEKVYDHAIEAKNARHKVDRGQIHGVAFTPEQIQEFLDKAVENESLIVQLLTGSLPVDPEPEPIPEVSELETLVAELVAGADKYFWKSPRANSVQRVQLALIGDLSGVDYLIESYRTRIYSAQHEYVLAQLNKIKVAS